MKRTPVVSKPIASVGYDAQSGTLEIEFRTGDLYEYYDVPVFVHRALLAAKSKGRFFQDKIANGYRFTQSRSGKGRW
jgi:hypothetical protein